MFLYQTETELVDYVCQYFNTFFPFHLAGREVSVNPASLPLKVDVLGEDDSTIYLVEFKRRRATGRNFRQLQNYTEVYRPPVNKKVIGVLAAPEWSLEARELASQHHNITLKLLNNVRCIAYDHVTIYDSSVTYNNATVVNIPQPKAKSRLHLCFTDAEWEAVQAQAKANNLTISEYIRRRALEEVNYNATHKS